MLYLNKIKELCELNEVKLIYATYFGSKLYRTNTENSDTDIKGIYIPNEKQIIIGQYPDHITFKSNKSKEKNSKEDVDITLYSIYKFFDLLKKGEIGAIDLLFSMISDSVIYSTKESEDIYKNKVKFLSKNFKAFIGYCIGQASKYGIKGSRYGDLLKFYNEVKKLEDDNISLSEVLDKIDFKDIKYVKIIEQNGNTYISLLGKLHLLSVSLKELKSRIEKQLDTFGHRTKQASNGVDWKALSHAVRVLLEMEELIKTKTIKFPLKETELIKTIKYETDINKLQEYIKFIEVKLKEVDKLLENSDLPTKVNQQEIDELLYIIVKRSLNYEK